jgi:hypothetical protein
METFGSAVKRGISWSGGGIRFPTPHAARLFLFE